MTTELIKEITATDVIEFNKKSVAEKQFSSKYFENTAKKLKNVLDVHFSGLLQYFYKVFFEFDKNKATILVSRRCLLLAEWFLFDQLYTDDKISCKYKLVSNTGCMYIENKETGKRNYILSDKGIFMLFSDKKIKSEIECCSIVDDIVIHGRQLKKHKKVVKSLIKLAGVSKERKDNFKVEDSAYMGSYESIIHYPDNIEIMTYDANWLILSRRIVDAICFLNMPYISYLTSYVRNNVEDNDSDAFIDLLDGRGNIITLPFGEDSRENLGKLSYFITEKESGYTKYEKLKCIRYYYNYKTHSATLVPYVIIDSLENCELDKEETLNKIFGVYLKDNISLELSKLLCDLYVTTFAEFEYDDKYEREEIVNTYRKHIYYLLSCVASKSYGYSFFKNNNMNFEFEKWNEDTVNCLKMTFDKNIVEIIINRSSYKNNIENAEKKRITIDEKKCYELKQNYYDQIDMFCRYDWQNSERYAILHKGYPEKLELKSILTHVLGSNDDFTGSMLCLCNIIDFCDKGLLSMSSNAVPECVVAAGELGALSARNYNKNAVNGTKSSNLAFYEADVKIGIKKLLSEQYYKYLLV